MSKEKKNKPPSPISLRLTFEEHALLKQAAGNMTLSAYIRQKLFDKSVTSWRRKRKKEPVQDHKALMQVLGTLGKSRIANNLNQLAKAMNMGILPVNPETQADIKQACLDIRNIRAMLMKALGLKTGGKS